MSHPSQESPFSLRPFGQTDLEQDYALLHILSNAQVPQDPQGNLEWQRKRREYDESQGTRRHYIAVHKDTQEAVGYACLEQQGATPMDYRMYLVFDPEHWTFAELGEFLYTHLMRDAEEVGAKAVALVEYASDLPFLTFLQAHGFAQAGAFIYNGLGVVRMEKRLQE